ncbi:3108_t:CDS:2 [Dentiscutata heterogama]|uniref:3108_t:CDS:1 n=1 Tax=Dentiscutata heterogama TaxID=1316150 RepID=A0ACA9KD85_9GLOM|nr:3108_t:CDS:2 [Dentiscutata heterogama]
MIFYKLLFDEDVTGFIQLTSEADLKALRQELIDKVPVQNSTLTLGPKFQIVNNSTIIQLHIDGNVASDLDNMIKNKNITTFSSGMTSLLDQDIGFQKTTIYTVYNVYKRIEDPNVRREFRDWIAVLTILAVTDYEYLTILKFVLMFNDETIDYKYLTIMKDFTKAEVDEYLNLLKDKIKLINILKILKDELPRSNESGIFYRSLFK